MSTKVTVNEDLSYEFLVKAGNDVYIFRGEWEEDDLITDLHNWIYGSIDADLVSLNELWDFFSDIVKN